MKIDKDIMIIKQLRFDNGEECLEVMDGEDVEIIVEFKQQTKTYKGQFGFVDDKHFLIDGMKVCIEDVIEINILQ